MVSGLPFYGQPDIFFILLKATVPYTLGDISVDTNLYYPLGTYLSDSTYCGEQFLEDASPFYSFDENKVKLFSYDSFGRLVKINNTPSEDLPHITAIPCLGTAATLNLSGTLTCITI